jgi:hypothetical protein
MANGNGRNVVDFERLEDELEAHRTQLPQPGYETPRFGADQHTTLQVIGHAITRLTWKDAERMGAGIQAEMKEDKSLAAAIQAWAEEWEKFDS